MLKLLCASAALVALASGAQAQSYEWSGLYLGAEIGAGRSAVSFDASATDYAGNHDGDAMIGGVFAGYDWQFGRFVYGLVGDVDAVHSADLAFGDPDALTGGKGEAYTYDMDWVATARARLGYAPTERLLIYGTGGMAAGHFEATSYSYPTFGSPSAADYSGVKLGGVLGAGIDYALPNDWTLKVEYLHYEFESFTFGGDGVPDTVFNPKLDAVKFGLAYRW
ncbi:outer membrane protein [Aquibium microcysteis]|uniref:outer membrane protein n=1 Tax=Aquibium microcysteis TaxID=675281 RepID=UPI00165D0371|nr:outer membrane beta-barrel protein [Aquibium microcysteis]